MESWLDVPDVLTVLSVPDVETSADAPVESWPAVPDASAVPGALDAETEVERLTGEPEGDAATTVDAEELELVVKGTGAVVVANESAAPNTVTAEDCSDMIAPFLSELNEQ